MSVFSFGFSEIVEVESLVVDSLSCKVDSSTDNASFIKVSSWESYSLLKKYHTYIILPKYVKKNSYFNKNLYLVLAGLTLIKDKEEIS